jgi:hypothetical protein
MRQYYHSNCQFATNVDVCLALTVKILGHANICHNIGSLVLRSYPKDLLTPKCRDFGRGAITIVFDIQDWTWPWQEHAGLKLTLISWLQNQQYTAELVLFVTLSYHEESGFNTNSSLRLINFVQDYQNIIDT